MEPNQDDKDTAENPQQVPDTNSQDLNNKAPYNYLNKVANTVTKIQDNKEVNYRVRNNLSALVIIAPVAVILLVLALLPISSNAKLVAGIIFAVILIITCITLAIKYSRQK